MGLNSSSVSTNMANFYEAQKNNMVYPGGSQPPYVDYPNPSDEFILKFQDIYFADAQSGECDKESVIISDGANKDLLYFAVQNNIITASNFASAISNYWSAKTTHGTPLLCGNTIVSITNDASKIKTPIEAYMLGLTSSEKNPPYNHLFSFIESQVKTIIWTITELSGPECTTPTSYTASVS